MLSIFCSKSSVIWCKLSIAISKIAHCSSSLKSWGELITIKKLEHKWASSYSCFSNLWNMRHWSSDQLPCLQRVTLTSFPTGTSNLTTSEDSGLGFEDLHRPYLFTVSSTKRLQSSCFATSATITCTSTAPFLIARSATCFSRYSRRATITNRAPRFAYWYVICCMCKTRPW